MLENYLAYLKSILGIERAAISPATTAIGPVFLLEKSPSLQSVFAPGPTAELFEKMLAALGWKLDQVQVKEVELQEIEKQKLDENAVILTSTAQESQWPTMSLEAIKSYHPAEMVANPHLKRAAWEHLQRIRRK